MSKNQHLGMMCTLQINLSHVWCCYTHFSKVRNKRCRTTHLSLLNVLTGNFRADTSTQKRFSCKTTTQHFTKSMFHFLNEILSRAVIHLSFIEYVCFPGATSALHIDHINLVVQYSCTRGTSIEIHQRILLSGNQWFIPGAEHCAPTCPTITLIIKWNNSDENLKRCCCTSASCYRPAKPIILHVCSSSPPSDG